MDRAALIAAMQATAQQTPIPVEAGAWGTVYVRRLTVEEVDEASEDGSDDKDNPDGKKPRDKNKLARAACRVLCDETGRRLFDPRSDDDVRLLSKQPWALLRTVLKASDPAVGNG